MHATDAQPRLRLITPRFQTRVWGSRDLSAWYPQRGLEPEPVGEAWLTPPQCRVLVKLLFPCERLSVQVHPDDAYAAAHGLGRGKSEAWYVIEAEPEARLGVGLRSGVGWDELEPACRAGRAADLLDWVRAVPGDLIYVPAGTVHAIGPGMVLCEVQQPSDTTFRLDDYGRGRAMQLEQGLEVARETTGGKIPNGLPAGGSGLLLETPFFQIWRHCTHSGWTLPAINETRWLVALTDTATIPRGALAELAPGASLSTSGEATLLEIQSGPA